MTQAQQQVLAGCGILAKEIRYLIEKNGWPVHPCLLPSALHSDFHKLGHALEKMLEQHRHLPRTVFYGACHPLMGRILDKAHTVRTPGQNCIDIYLGEEIFSRELSQGAFFLFEDWAQNWDAVMALSIGEPKMVRMILQSAHSYFLAIRTPCSCDFSREANDIARRTGLELRWIDAGLERLEETLARTLGLEIRSLS